MANEQNLIPLTERGKEDAKRIRQMGQAAQTVARRRKRSLREAADVYLSLPVSDRRTWNKIARCGVDPEDIDNQMAMIIGLTMAATAGDARAAKVIVDHQSRRPYALLAAGRPWLYKVILCRRRDPTWHHAG